MQWQSSRPAIDFLRIDHLTNFNRAGITARPIDLLMYLTPDEVQDYFTAHDRMMQAAGQNPRNMVAI